MTDFGLSKLLHKKFETGVQTIVDEYIKLEDENKRLREENAKLKAANYKDIELADLNDKLNRVREESSHYGLLESDYNELKDWWEHHIKFAHSDNKKSTECKKMKMQIGVPSYHYEIHELPVGISYTIKCTCGEEHTIFY